MSVVGGESPRQWVYANIANIAGDQVESGQYHLYRGILNPLGPGKEFLKLFDIAVDELVRLGMDNDRGEKQKEQIRKNIQTAG